MSNIKQHFVFKLLTNIVRIPVSLVLQSIFPRLLGPIAYGNFDFLTDFANKIINFFDQGTSVRFYTKLSQDNSNNILIKYYAWLVLIVSLVYILFVLLTQVNLTYKLLWPGQEYNFILLSSMLGIVTYCSNGILKMVDACELTVKGEWVKIGQLFLSVAIFFTTFLIFQKVSLQYFYLIQLFLIFILLLGNVYILKKAGFSPFPNVQLTWGDIVFYSKSFWMYLNPLILLGLISLIAGLAERWILQLYGGSVQQGFFALSYKISTFVFLFTGAMMPLLMREVSKSFASNDLKRIKMLFIKNIKILYFLVTFMSVFVAMNSKFITLILAGKDFDGARAVVSLMAFYPIHQTLGQINGTLYMSTERTKLYRNVSVFFIPLTLFFSFFLMAPVKYYGMGLGATGLAFEMIFIQLIAQNILLYFNCKYLKLSFQKLLYYQIGIVGLLLLLGWLEREIIDSLMNNIYLISFSHFVIFSTTFFGLVYVFPNLIGLENRQDLKVLLKFK